MMARAASPEKYRDMKLEPEMCGREAFYLEITDHMEVRYALSEMASGLAEHS